jgi:hypothetical protein
MDITKDYKSLTVTRLQTEKKAIKLNSYTLALMKALNEL